MSVKKETLDKCIDLAKKIGATKVVLFGSALHEPEKARDIDLACDGIDGWRLYEFGAKLEELNPSFAIDVLPLSPPTRFTRHVEQKGRILYESRRTS